MSEMVKTTSPESQATPPAMRTIKLAPVLDLAAAAKLLDELRQRRPAALCMDASDVEIITVPCLQIVVAALRDHAASGIGHPSARFLEAVRALGFMPIFEGRLDVTVSANGDGMEPVAEDLHSRPAEPLTTQDQTAMTTRILTIDDSRTIRDMLKLTLSDAGFEVLQAVDGQDGVDVLGREAVDIVITDINMPKMDGYGVIRHMRGRPEYQRTPILVLTTESETDKKTLAREAGATGWIVKPFDPDRLVETIKRIAV
jgi:two-component system, chemotaxis family, chemotaxis protein CheY